MKKLLVVALFFVLFNVTAQIDTVFWFAVPEVADNHGDEPVSLNFSTLDEPATITVSIPRNAGFTPIEINLAANSFHRLVLDYYNENNGADCWKSSDGCGADNFLPYLENITANTAVNKGLLIESTAEITVYYEVLGSACQDADWIPSGECNIINTDIFSLKGNNGLGTEFMISGQTGHYTTSRDYWANNMNAKSSFDIVAAEDCDITIQLPAGVSAEGVGAGQTINISLLKGQTYSVRAIDDVPSTQTWNSLVGTKISSTGKIAVTYKDDSVADRDDYARNFNYNGGQGPTVYDLIGDQLIPIELAGQEFIIQGGYGYVTALENNTSLTIHSSTGEETVILNEGETHELDLKNNDDPVYILSDNNVQLFHIRLIFGASDRPDATGVEQPEFGGAIIPHLKCTGSKSVSFNRSSNESGEEFFVTLIVKTGGEGSFTLNGDNTKIQASDFVDVPGSNGGWKFANIEFTVADIPVKQTSTVKNADQLFHLGITSGRPDQSGLINSTGSRYGYFSNFEEFEFEFNDVTECIAGSSVDVELENPNNNLSFVWQTGNPADTTNTLTVTETSSIEVEVTNELGCVTIATVDVKLTQTPDFDLPKDTLLCQLDTTNVPFPLSRESLGDNWFQWRKDGSPITAQADSSIYINGFQPGFYTLTVENECGKDSAGMVVSDFPTKVNIDGQKACEDVPLTLTAESDTQLPDVFWSTDRLGSDTLSEDIQYTTETAGVFYLIGSQVDETSGKECRVTDSTEVFDLESIAIEVASDTIVCPGEPVDLWFKLLTEAEYSSLTWSKDGNPFSTNLNDTLITITEPGVYGISLDNSCEGEGTQIEVKNWDIEVPNIFTPNGDDKNEEFVVEGITESGTWKLEVYNRWGRRVYRNDDYKNNWNAVDVKDSDDIRDGVYYFELSQDDECNYYKGWVTIVR